MFNSIKRFFVKRLKKTIPNYSLLETFGCSETLPQECPTFLIREVHRQFESAMQMYNIIVVYGESRQGKTWTIEKYCPNQIRVGCQADMTLDSIKDEMLSKVNANALEIEHTVTEEFSRGEKQTGRIESSAEACLSVVGAQLVTSAGKDITKTSSYTEEIKTKYNSFDRNNFSMFIEILKERTENRFFVFDNFHYLPPSVQQDFCSLLKEFNYNGIKVIIVGVWKDASKITALAPDLVNRCQHINIGYWDDKELNEVLCLGEKALNIRFTGELKKLFIKYSVNNVGICKDFVQRYLLSVPIKNTQKTMVDLKDIEKARETMNGLIMELYTPLRDRIINLALPHKAKKDSKYLRLKIIISILTLLKQQSSNRVEYGFTPADIKYEIDRLCQQMKEPTIDISNITQELGKLHLREENRQTSNNFISLFYYDKAKKRLLVLEPTLYAIKANDIKLVDKLISELKESINGDSRQLSIFN